MKAEDTLQANIVAYLRAALPERAFRVFAVPNGGGRSKAEAGIMKATGTLAGVPDLIIVGACGRAFFIEVKTQAGRLSPAQHDFRAWMVLASVPYVIARSLHDVEVFLEHHRLGRRFEREVAA